MATPLMERPQQPAPPIRPFPKGTGHFVAANESWISLAQPLGIDPWELIEFNFPGVKQVKQADTERASRQVNWYLSEYVGCRDSGDGGRNYAFGGGLAGRGKGDYRGGVIFLPPVRKPAPSCAFDVEDAVRIEGEAAARVRALSSDVATGFIRTLGGVGRTGRFIPSITDDKYWFAKLYEVVTIHEIYEARSYRHPAFVLHFIPIFYDMYHQALQKWTNRNRAVGQLWANHFGSTGEPDRKSTMGWTLGVQTSIETGVTAHVKGDMPIALERAYFSYARKYCLNPAPAFEDFRADFFAMGSVFDRARTILLAHVAQMGPFPEAAVAIGEKLFSRLSSSVVDGWRKEAWAEAQRRIENAGIRSNGTFPAPVGASAP